MNISVPDPMKDWVQAQIDEGKYASSSDYVRDLTRLDCFDTISLLSACRQHSFEVFQRLASSFRHMAQNKNKPGRADPTVQ